MAFAVGSLVRARGREWVVLPASDDADVLMVRPLGGADHEVTGLLTELEDVEAATFALPNPAFPGDHRSCRLLRDAMRLGFRSSAGPFRSFGHIAVEPRPYQLVPLLMALKLDPVRLLIADDVGIGKTVEAGLIARELMDRGEVDGLAVLCPPHLAEQWQDELARKFNIDAELVLSSTAPRLQRDCRIDQSIFDLYRKVIVSTDYIKSDTHRDEFLRTCPSLVIVDEAHTCADASEGHTARHQRHRLLTALASSPARHLILVTATPHSGNETAFRSLLSFLNPAFADLPDDITGSAHEHHRRALAAHLVQRRRGDIHSYMGATTDFPTRQDAEENYKLSPAYQHLFERVLDYARETVRDSSGGAHRQRVRWWSALALLRSLASSPAAAAATLRTRAATAETTTEEEANQMGRRTVLDLMDDEASEGIDVTPGSDSEGQATPSTTERLRSMAAAADALCGEKDNKLTKAILLIKDVLNDGGAPIVFCRFITTAEYVADALRTALPDAVTVDCVTGLLPPEDREDRVQKLSAAARRVLVCTDCLSEGVNLQQSFNAVFHYDLSWNPTRHEQRDGRVDRYGQPSPQVRVLTYYGTDNQIDGIVLDVLLRKHRTIRSSLGISVPVPVATEAIVEAIFEGLLLRERAGNVAAYLPGFDEYFAPQKEDVHSQWDVVADRERRSRTMFAQAAIKVEEVTRELRAVQEGLGLGVDVRAFLADALRAQGAVVEQRPSGSLRCRLGEAPQALREIISPTSAEITACFTPPAQHGETYLNRTHPTIEGLAAYTLDLALDPQTDPTRAVARRCGVIRTKAVQRRTTALLLRYRFQITDGLGSAAHQLLAEDWQLLAFTGMPPNAVWLDDQQAQELLDAQPTANVAAEIQRDHLSSILANLPLLQPALDGAAQTRAEELRDAHTRVRTSAIRSKQTTHVKAHLPPDVLGLYLYLPA